MLKKIRDWLRSRSGEKRAVDAQRLVISEKLFDLSPELIAELRRAQAADGTEDQITRAYDAFLLDPGLGPATYLSTDGTILWDDDLWGVEPNARAAYAAIVVGAEKTGVQALLELLPDRPSKASDCVSCGGTGWFSAQGAMMDREGRPFRVVCECGGLGWQVAG